VGTDLPDILISDSANLLDVGSRLGDVLQRVPSQDDFVFDVFAGLDCDTGVHYHTTDDLLANEVTKNIS
jgi:hypothetical protein